MALNDPNQGAGAPSCIAVMTPSSSTTSIGVSSGGGWRSVTSTAPPSASTYAARAPAAQPPLPEPAGPLKRAGTTRGSRAEEKVLIP